MACPKEAGERGWTPIFAGSSASATRAGSGPPARTSRPPSRGGAPPRAHPCRTIAANERRHADVWATRLREEGVEVPPTDGPRARIRFILLIARLFGTKAVSDLVRALEGDA